MARKFIVNDNNLIFGDVDLHKQLCKDHSKTVGGGYWHIDKEQKKIYLYSHSMDFKRAKIGDVIAALHGGHVPAALQDYVFYYSHSDGLNDALKDSVKVGKYYL